MSFLLTIARRGLRSVALLLASLFLAAPAAFAHEFTLDAMMNGFVKVEPGALHLVIRAPLYVFKTVTFPANGRELVLDRSAPAVQRALAGLAHDVSIFEDGRALVPSSASGRVSLPSDRSFGAYADAAAHVDEPMPSGMVVYVDQGFFDAHLVYPIASTASRFAIRTVAAPELKDYLKFTLRYLAPGEEARAMLITSASGIVSLNPGALHAVAEFVGLGVAHILTGFDHLLFLLCLVIPLRGWRQILAVVTVFTVAHSFTLLGAAFGLAPSGAWFPPFVEAAIAASIVYMALENIMGANVQRRVLVTGLFGLVHGFGFSYGLQESLQFAGTHLVLSLFAFNLGIEIGQVLALALMLPVLALARRTFFRRRIGIIIMSALVAHTGWHWLVERGEVLLKTAWPQPSSGDWIVLALWVAGLSVAAAAIAQALQRWRVTPTLAVKGGQGFAD